jgi:hypothetical protein
MLAGDIWFLKQLAVWDAEMTLPEKESPITSRPPLACTSGNPPAAGLHIIESIFVNFRDDA